MFLVELEGHTWAVPFRSHIRHKYAFFTDAENRCGIDYSKAVIDDKPEHIDESVRPHLRFAVHTLNRLINLSGVAI